MAPKDAPVRKGKKVPPVQQSKVSKKQPRKKKAAKRKNKKDDYERSDRDVPCLRCTKSAISGKSNGVCVQLGGLGRCERCYDQGRTCESVPDSVEEYAIGLVELTARPDPKGKKAIADRKEAIADAKAACRKALEAVSRIDEEDAGNDGDAEPEDDGDAEPEDGNEDDDINEEDITAGAAEGEDDHHPVSKEVRHRRARIMKALKVLVKELIHD